MNAKRELKAKSIKYIWNLIFHLPCFCFRIYPCIQVKVPINTVDGDGDGREGREVGKGKGAPLSPVLFPFSLPPYPLTLSTPATQATLLLRT